MSEKITIRTAHISDAEKLLEVYAPYVEKTAVTYEYTVPSTEEFAGRIEKTLKKYPYLVALRSDEILGYAYAGAFIGRAASDWSQEMSIYLKDGAKGLGIGRALYTTLEKIAKLQNIHNLNAAIAYPEQEDEYLTLNSVQFHSHMDYKIVAKFNKCGYKFGRWYSLVWMEKIITEHEQTPSPFVPFPQLDKDKLRNIGIEL